MDKKRTWLWIGLAVLVFALTAWMFWTLVQQGHDPWELILPRPIGPILPPIRIPKV
jgi:uncharacterized protein YggT (Ycf19 family)